MRHARALAHEDGSRRQRSKRARVRTDMMSLLPGSQAPKDKRDLRQSPSPTLTVAAVSDRSACVTLVGDRLLTQAAGSQRGCGVV